MQVRKATSADTKELVRLLTVFYNHTQSELSAEQATFRAYKDVAKMNQETIERYVSHPGYTVFVAEENETLKGFICGKIEEKGYRKYDKEGYVEEWFVEEDSQSKGVGKELFDKLTEEFQKEECTHMGLDTHLENTKAMQIYEHMGFKKRLVTFFKPLRDLS